MKAVINNIINSLLVMGMIMVGSSVSAETRERTTRTVGSTRTMSTATNDANAGGRRTVSAPNGSSSIKDNKDKATTTGRANSVNRSSSANSSFNRPVTGNTGNSSANHWPNQNKPTINSNNNSVINHGGDKNNNKNNGGVKGTTTPAEVRNGSLARPGTMNNNYNNNRHGSVTVKPSSWHSPVAPPSRTYRPADHKMLRPSLPKHYTPYANAPRITGFLGLTFGYSYYNSLDYLFDRGYEIDGYTNRAIYLRNVTDLNFFWPDAIINYSSRGLMENAEFHYSTRYNDNSRYSRLYTYLCSLYGSPVSYKRTSNRYEAVWYGGDARGFITLEYYYYSGRYYTTVAYGY